MLNCFIHVAINSWILATLILVLCLTNCASAATPNETLDRVRQNIRNELLGSISSTTPSAMDLPESVEQDLATLRPDGSWPDQIYTDINQFHWKALAHLPRLERITRAYCRAGANQPKVLDQILTSLGFWLRKDPQNTNWWHNEIGVPREVGMIMVMLGDQLPPDLRQRGTELMKRANWSRQTGANLIDETWIQVMRGCVENDPDVVSQGFIRTWQELRIVSPHEEGIQIDGTFHQHGPMLYNMGYGTVFLSDALKFIAASTDTPYAPPASVMDSIYTTSLDADLWMTRGNCWDFGVCGRGICRIGVTESHGLWSMLQQLAKLPGGRSAELANDIENRSRHPEMVAIGNRHFPCSDYMVQRRPDYFASIRMYSTRTSNTDSLTNGENGKSHHIADGTTCLMVSGNEYFNIYPYWDWLRIPGTTIEQDPGLTTKYIKRIGKSAFVGGASDGSNGCAAMDLIYNKLHASKAWFCFDHQIVCLGVAIDCNSNNAVLTTLNQSLLAGNVYADSEASPLTVGDHPCTGVHWIWHDHIGYVLPNTDTRDNIDIQFGPRQGAWADIGVGSDRIETHDVFSAVINHGVRPNGGTYAYVLLPGIDLHSMPAAAALANLKIISNTARLQAVWNGDTQQLQAVFHEPGDVQFDGMHLSVDQPCLLLFSRTKTGATLAVANPLNQAATIHVTTGSMVTKVELPGGDRAGETVTVAVQTNK